MDSAPSTPIPAETAAQPRCTSEFTAVIARWIVGGAFLYMGMHKVLDPPEFLELVRQYDIVSTPVFLNAIAGLLPWFEVVCGLLLLAGVAVRGAAVITLAMLIPFTIIVAMRAHTLSTAQGLAFCAVKFDCGCGGGEIPPCPKLLENVALMLICLWLATGRGKKLSLRYSLSSQGERV